MLQKTIKKNNGISRHIQLKQIVMEMISSNYEIGNQFLSGRELMKRFKVSSTTVSKVMEVLVAENILERRVGKGTFIKDISGLSLQQENYNIFPTLIFSTSHMQAKSCNPLSWFINGEINNGIVSSYPGRCLIKSIPDILSGINKDSKLPVILLNPSQEDIEKIDISSVPYVIINQDINTISIPKSNSIRWECFTGIHHLISLFTESGHKKIAMIAGKSNTHAQRINSFKFNMQEFNIDICPEYLIEETVGYKENGYKAMEQLLNLSNPPTAVFVDTDIKAEGAVEAAVARGLTVPGDISIAGFDDMPDAASFNPPLTTIRVPYFEMGMEAVKMLQQILNNNYPQKAEILHTELIIRNTTGKSPIDLPSAVTDECSTSRETTLNKGNYIKKYSNQEIVNA